MQVRAKLAAVMAGVFMFSGSFALVHGDEPKACHCPEAGVPILSKIPYVSRLFKNVGVAHEASCEAGHCQTPCADQLERVGVDFDFGFGVCQTCPDGVVRFGPIELAVCSEDAACCCKGKECPAACASCSCPSAGKLTVSQCAAEGETICLAAKCGEGKCCEAKCCAVAKTSDCQCAGRDELWKHLVEMAEAKGAAEAALEGREEQSELLDALVEMATKGAALEAKLEAQAEQHKLMEQMVELASENAQLKARAELADAKAEMLRETLPIAIEKELLARRVTELEQRLAGGDEGVRTARKANARKSAR